MFKRMRWLGLGALAGVGASVWTQRKARVMADRYRPAGLAVTAAGRARDWPGRVRAAVAEGRLAMHEREAELRGNLQPPDRRPAIDAGSRPGRPADQVFAGRSRLADH